MSDGGGSTEVDIVYADRLNEPSPTAQSKLPIAAISCGGYFHFILQAGVRALLRRSSTRAIRYE
jgi:hypothetical protein